MFPFSLYLNLWWITAWFLFTFSVIKVYIYIYLGSFCGDIDRDGVYATTRLVHRVGHGHLETWRHVSEGVGRDEYSNSDLNIWLWVSQVINLVFGCVRMQEKAICCLPHTHRSWWLGISVTVIDREYLPLLFLSRLPCRETAVALSGFELAVSRWRDTLFCYIILQPQFIYSCRKFENPCGKACWMLLWKLVKPSTFLTSCLKRNRINTESITDYKLFRGRFKSKHNLCCWHVEL